MYWRSIRWHHLAWLSAIVLVAAGVRFFNISRNSLWTDEFLSLECSSGWARSDMALAGRSMIAPDLITLKNARPWTAIWSSIGRDENHPPLYFILLRFWRECFGDTPAALRSMSVVASLIAIVLLFAIGVEVHSPRAGLWACLLMALASPQIEQAQDARAYMPVTAACLAAAFLLVRNDRLGPSWPRCIALFFVALLAPLMHYMAFASFAAMLIYAIFIMRGESRKAVVRSLIASLVAIALLWGPQMLQQHYRMIDDTAWLIDNQTKYTGSVLTDLCNLPVRLFMDLDLGNPPVACLGAAAFVLPLMMWRHRQVRLWWIWLAVPAAVALCIDLSTHRRTLSMIRYTLAAAPAIYLMIAMLAAQLRRLGWIPLTVIAGSCALCVPSSYTTEIPDYRELPRFIASASQPNDPVIFVNSHPDTYCSEGLLCVTYYLQSQHHPIYLLHRAPAAGLLAQLKSARHVCVISDGLKSLIAPIVPGLKIDRTELLVGIAVVGTADPAADGSRMRQAKFATDPALKLALGMR
jgi:uncharacterized membrane protein